MSDVAASEKNVKRSVIDWLDDNYHFGDAEKLIETDDASFLDRGILDSLGYVQLILHLEKAFGLRIDRKDLSRANFDSLGKIVAYVVRHPEYRP
jgi:acyl carrier protein